MGRKIEIKEVSQNNMFSGTVDQAKARYNLGRDSVLKLANEAGAIIRIGRRRLIHFERLDRYLDSISE